MSILNDIKKVELEFLNPETRPSGKMVLKYQGQPTTNNESSILAKKVYQGIQRRRHKNPAISEPTA